MSEKMIPHVKLERTSAPKIFVADQIRDLGENTIPVTTHGGVHRRIKFWSANVVEPLISLIKVVQIGRQSAHSQRSGSHYNQTGRDQRSVHDRHVGLLL